MQSVRVQRVQELLKRQIGEVLQREFPAHEVGLITVNDVIVTKDLQQATVYVGVVGTEDKKKSALNLLQKERKKIQGLVGRAIVLKYTPQLRFVTDDSIPRGDRILKIIEDIERSSSQNEGTSQDH